MDVELRTIAQSWDSGLASLLRGRKLPASSLSTGTPRRSPRPPSAAPKQGPTDVLAAHKQGETWPRSNA